MAQLWKGRFKKELAKETNDFNSSIKFDKRMFEEDIKGSMAHAAMLGAAGIIDKSESEKIVDGLDGILKDIKNGVLEIDESAEDIHTFVEGELTKRLGDTGKGCILPAPEMTGCAGHKTYSQKRNRNNRRTGKRAYRSYM